MVHKLSRVVQMDAARVMIWRPSEDSSASPATIFALRTGCADLFHKLIRAVVQVHPERQGKKDAGRKKEKEKNRIK